MYTKTTVKAVSMSLIGGLILVILAIGCTSADPTNTPAPGKPLTAEPVATSNSVATATPDIEATAQARVQEILKSTRIAPTPTVAVSTPTPLPSPTAMEPIPTSTPNPTPTSAPTRTPTPKPPPTITPTPTRIAATDPTGFPPFPNIYRGAITIGGQPVEDGIPVFARIGVYQTPTILTKNGRYSNLIIGPPSSSYFNRTIAFFILMNGVEIQAAEVAVYAQLGLKELLQSLALTFP
ncbi:hypothetical protein FIM12_05440 [SAR202 cluster bacterium AD-804-J14_MRT_500m]|nr:hypothetical protein [SAR202 cluster bacterium AD-804-J14_MRT_500m]